MLDIVFLVVFSICGFVALHNTACYYKTNQDAFWGWLSATILWVCMILVQIERVMGQ